MHYLQIKDKSLWPTPSPIEEPQEPEGWPTLSPDADLTDWSDEEDLIPDRQYEVPDIWTETTKT